MKNIVKKLRKGFTIVELVIVIAIIAILAAVLIPTLANVIDQAEESNDIQTVSQLNTIASAYATVGEIETVNDALDGALENGYSVSALTPTSEGNVIVYDATSNRFALLSKDLTTVVYKDSATTKEDAEDWQTSTTWVIVTTSDVTLVDNVYTLTGSNSYVLVGDDWNGASVTAEYGVSLYDYKGTTTLGKLVIENDDDENSQQTIKAEDSTNSKSTVAKTTTANNTKVSSITVNVKAAYLSCSANVYTIKNYSTTTITAVVGNSQLAEYGTTSIYDASGITSGKITNYNKNISEDVIVKVANGQKAEDVLVDNTKTITVSAVATTTVTITVTTTSSTTVSITVDGSEIVSTNTTDGTTTITADLSGTSLKPYEISKASDLLDMESGCYKLVAEELETSSAVTIDADTDVTIDLNGNTLTITGAIVVLSVSGTDYYAGFVNKGTLTLSNGTITLSGAKYGIYNTGNLIVDGANIYGTYAVDDSAQPWNTDSYAIYNSGNVEVNSGIINGAGRGINNNGSIVTINGGTVESDYGFGILSSGTVKMTDGTISGYYGLHNSGTANISGGTIIGTSTTLMAIAMYNSGTATISGKTEVTVNTSVAGKWVYGIYVASTGNLTISDNVNISAKNSDDSGASAGVVYFGNGDSTTPATITISGGTIYGQTYGLSGNGSASYSNVTISGGSIEGGEVGYYHPEMGPLTISGGSIKGNLAGLQICAGELTITGGSLTATATADEIASNTNNPSQKTGDGIIADGAALSIIDRKGYGLTQSDGTCSFASGAITISGGTFTSASGVEAVQAYSYNSSNKGVTALGSDQTLVSITGGTFSSDLSGDYSAYCIATDYAATGSEGSYTVAKKATD